MIGRLFPKAFDNGYRGHWLAIWLLVLVVAMRLLIGFNSMVFTRSIATGPDAIPLDRYGAAGAAMVLQLFALLGLWHVLQASLAVLALIRYRAMIPLIYLLFLLQQVGNHVIELTHPVVSASNASSHSASILVEALFAMVVIGFGLSLLDWRSRKGPVVYTASLKV